jgi:pullulanase
MTLWDKIAQSTKAPVKEREKMQRLAAAIIFTSQGMCFIHSGQEMCRTKGGLHNSYNASEEVNMIHWDWKKKHRTVFDYYKGMIALRKAHPVFRLTSPGEIKKRLKFATRTPSPKAVSYTLKAEGIPGETCKRIRVMLNADAKPLSFTLPDGKWKVVVKDDKAGTEVLEEVEKKITIAPHSALICLQ